MSVRRVIMFVLISLGPLSEFALLINENAAFVECVSKSPPGAGHGQSKGPQHQEEAEVQELRGHGPAEEGRQGRKMPALRRDGGTVARLREDLTAVIAGRDDVASPESMRPVVVMNSGFAPTRAPE
jgi:hypothetical protein